LDKLECSINGVLLVSIFYGDLDEPLLNEIIKNVAIYFPNGEPIELSPSKSVSFERK
jgi:hypothetical protein